jgi:hypothetical protein
VIHILQTNDDEVKNTYKSVEEAHFYWVMLPLAVCYQIIAEYPYELLGAMTDDEQSIEKRI